MDKKESLMHGARTNGICLDGYNVMRSANTEALIDYYVQNPDWCMKRSYPPLDEMRNFVDIETRTAHGIFIDHRFDGELLDQHQAYIFHNCTGTVRVALNLEKKIIPMLYFANGCNMTVECTQSNAFPIRVPLYIFGENTVIAKDNNNAIYRRYTSKLIDNERPVD